MSHRYLIMVFSLIYAFLLNGHASQCDSFISNMPTNWQMVDKSQFPTQLITLFDASIPRDTNIMIKAMFKKRTREKQSSQTWRKYWSPVFNQRLPQWLLKNWRADRQNFDKVLNNAKVYYYGFEKSGGSWENDFMNPVNYSGNLHRKLQKLSKQLLKNTKIRRNWGLSSASNPMAMNYYAKCQQQKKRYINALYLLNITDHDANRSASERQSNEIKQVEIHLKKNPNTRIDDFNYLSKSIQNNRNYYYFTPISAAFFAPKEKSYEMNLDKLFARQCRYCKSYLYTSILEVKPAIPLQRNDFYNLNQAVIFKYTAKGYHGDIQLKRMPQKQKKAYQLKNICIRPKSKQFLWQCKAANQKLQYHFDLISTDEDEAYLEKPSVLLIKSLYVYQPKALAVGLVVESIQENKINYEITVKLKDDRIVTHALMKQYPNKTLQAVRDHENEKIETKRIRDKFIEMILSILLGCAIVVILIVPFYRFRHQFPAPQLKLSISDSTTYISDMPELVVLQAYTIDLDSLKKHPEIVIGHCQIKNSSGHNRVGAWEKLILSTVKINMQEMIFLPEKKATIKNDIKTKKNLLLLSDQKTYLNLPLEKELSWPIIFNANEFKGLRSAQLTTNELQLNGVIEIESSHRQLLNDKLSQQFSIHINIKPAKYRYAIEGKT